MAKSECMLTGNRFDHPNKSFKIDPFIVKEITNVMVNEEECRKNFFKALSKDSQCMEVVAQALLTIDAEEVGLSVPGTLADFFLRNWSKNT